MCFNQGNNSKSEGSGQSLDIFWRKDDRIHWQIAYEFIGERKTIKDYIKVNGITRRLASPFTEMGKSMREADLSGKIHLDMSALRCLVYIQMELVVDWCKNLQFGEEVWVGWTSHPGLLWDWGGYWDMGLQVLKPRMSKTGQIGYPRSGL